MKTPFEVIRTWVVVLTALIVTTVGCSREETVNTASIRLKWLHQAQFAGFYYANEAGYYGSRGAHVSLHPGGIDYPAVQMVVSGSDQFGVTGADQILIARHQNIPVVAVACIYRKTPFVLFSLKSSGISKIADFKGRRVGVKLGGNEELTYRAMMKNAGVPTSQVIEVPVKFDISPLLTGQVQVWPGYSINEPITAEEQGYAVNLIPPDAYNVHFYADVLFTTEEMIHTRPKLVAAVVQGTVQGWQDALKRKDLAIDYTLKYGNGLNRQHEMKMLTVSVPLIRPDSTPLGSMDLPAWKEMDAFLKSDKFVKGDIDVSQAFRTDFLPGAR